MGQPDADTPTGLVRWLRLVTTAFRLSACRCHTPGQRRIGRIFLQILDKAFTIPSARGSNLSSLGRQTLRAALRVQARETSVHNHPRGHGATTTPRVFKNLASTDGACG